MSTNKKLKAKYKSYIGRLFSLRKCTLIPAYDSPKETWQSKHWVLDREKELGEVVFVLDETNSRVCVLRQGNGVCWIQKYFLHKEIPGVEYKPEDSYNEIIALILGVSKKIREHTELLISDAQALEDAAKNLRQVSEK